MACFRRTGDEHPTCGCCEWRYAKRYFSELGNLCGTCAQHHSDLSKGRKMFSYEDRNRQLNHRRQNYTTCPCCELGFKGVDTILLQFECRRHAYTYCINCAESHDVCPIDNTSITNASASKRESKREERHPATPIAN